MGALSQPGSILLLGATSDIGGQLARRLCPGREVFLAARRPDQLGPVCEQLRQAGAGGITTAAFDAADSDSLLQVIDEAFSHGPVAAVIVAFGVLGDQRLAESDPKHAAQIATIDYTAQIVALTGAVEHALAQAQGPARRGDSPTCTIYAFSSIAGWRARRANYVYGSTKAGLDAFCQGLCDRLHTSSVQLLIARPGFVIGSMTAGMDPAPLSSTPQQVAEALVGATKAGRRGTVWIPGALRLLAWVMACVPRPLWRHMPR